MPQFERYEVDGETEGDLRVRHLGERVRLPSAAGFLASAGAGKVPAFRTLTTADLPDRIRSFEITHFVLEVGTPDEAVRGTNLRYSAWAFDATTIEGVVTPTFQVPRDYASGALIVVLHWTNLGAGSGNVVWRVAAKP